jgi:hypothetical protein
MNYDVRKLVIRDEAYCKTDFVVKFMLMNQVDFEELRLINITCAPAQANSTPKPGCLLSYLPNHIHRLHLENINIERDSLR